MKRAEAMDFYNRVAEERQCLMVSASERRNTEKTLDTALKLADASPAASVLDVGCGDGTYLKLLEGMDFKRLVGVDFADSMLKHARKACNRSKIMKGDAENLRFRDSSFDIVLCMAVLRHLNNPYRCLKEIRKVLKPGGKICVSVFNSKGYRLKSLFMRDDIYNLKNQPHNKESIYTPLMMKKALQDAGFRNVRVRSIIFTFSYIPEWLLPFSSLLEFVLENLPVINSYGRNIIAVGEKP